MFTTRRQVLAGLAATGATTALSGYSFTSWAPLRINAQRLQSHLEGLSVFGRPPGGTFADGVSRVAYSDADVAGRKHVMATMAAAGLEPRLDTAGNIFTSRPGTDPAAKPILFGSHIDSVANGGNFDGDLGSLAALEVLRTLNENKVATRHPLEAVIWQNEEGGLVGSSAVAGQPLDLDRKYYGVPLAEGLRKIGGDPARLADARKMPGWFHCYLEMHIEQSGNLEKAGIPVGVVEGIVAIDDYDVEIRGFANHAGTTPMPERRNALLAAARLIEAVQQIVTRAPGRQVGTVGKLEVHPNAVNVIPGLVKHSIELRDLSAEKIARLGAEISNEAGKIAEASRTEIILRKVRHNPPAMATPALQETIAEASAQLGLKTMRLPSGAGHDAQMMAKLGPMAMIFVPSVGGVSHSPKELTSWTDCANGANVLLHTILAVDKT